MNNLFDYATKELSQDAFLRWFISHADCDCEDQEMQGLATQFLKFLCNEDMKIEQGKAKVETFAQLKYMDVVVKIYPDRNSYKHYLLVIEDKNGTSEHNQLVSYDKTIEEWEDKEKVFRVFYKPGLLSQADLDGIKKAKNEGGKVWKQYNINKIYEFFGNIHNCKSQVLNDYCDYIRKIHDTFEGKIDKELDNISINEWECFINGQFKDKNVKDKSAIWVDDYQKKYMTINYQRYFKNSKNGAVIEILVREKRYLKCVFHHAFYKDGVNHHWSYDAVSDNNIKSKEIHDKLVKYIEDKNLGKVKSSAKSVFGKFDEDFEAHTADELIEKVKEWIDRFDKLVNDIDNNNILLGLEYPER